MSRRRSAQLLIAIGMAAVTACTGGAGLGSSGTVTLTAPTTGLQVSRTANSTPTSISPTPVTPNGLITGIGVDDTTMTLGMLVDEKVDRGFTTGVALWQKTVNTSGGLCGRRIRLLSASSGESLPDAYPRVAGAALGLITLSSPADVTKLDAMATADQIPALTLSGSSAHLSRTGPVPVAATEDIKAINALAYLRSKGKLAEGSTLYVLTDESVAASSASAGAAWWAQTSGVTLVSRRVGGESTDLTDAGAVLVIADPAQVAKVLLSAPRNISVITNLDGYDPSLAPDSGGRLLVTMAAPVFGSDNPGAAAVAKAFVAAGESNPGANLMSGYGVAAAWGRLIVQACTSRILTHAGIMTAMTTVGPASVDSLFGPSDPGLVVKSALPATRVSSLALADPHATAGLSPLIWLQAAPGIGDYTPPR